jgi:acyl-[acyl-carrier-protein]-phospholipid O-acyltransferase/long-chain-fatty-acid--[acyl-carrier-protein] ligase
MSSEASKIAPDARVTVAFAGLAAAECIGSFGNAAVVMLVGQRYDITPWMIASCLVFYLAAAIQAAQWAALWSTQTVIVSARAAQATAILLAGLLLSDQARQTGGVASDWDPALLFALLAGALGFTSSAKHLIVRDGFAGDQISRVSGILGSAGFLGTLLGVFAGLSLHEEAAGRIDVGLALLAGATSLSIPPALVGGFTTRPHASSAAAGATLGGVLAEITSMFSTRSFTLSVLGAAYFWLLAMTVFVGLHAIPADSIAWLIGWTGQILLGLAVGGVLAAYLSAGNVELGLVPLGAVGLAGSLFGLCATASAAPSFWFTLWLVTFGLSGGLFLVPLVAMLLWKSSGATVGATMAMSNGLNVVLMLAAWIGLGRVVGEAISPSLVFLAGGLLTVCVTAYVCWLLPEFLFRFLFWSMTHTFYRLRVLGREHIPATGPGLLICNHVSYADGFFLVASHHRLIRFVIWGGIANQPHLRWLARVMGVIPIAASDGPRALAASLRAARDSLRSGELVCVFAEGQISRTGNMLKFKRGFEKVVQGTDAPIIPTFLDCVWGSIFSHQGGRFFWKWPRLIPYPVTVSFGKPLPATTEAFQVRQAVQELGADSIGERKHLQRPVHTEFVRQAARHPFRFCIADSRGTELTYGWALAGVVALSRVFGRRLAEDKMVGVLLPPSVGGTLVNLGLLAAGKVPVNLNYTASTETVASCVRQCEIKTIISSPEVLKRLKLSLPFDATAIEDLRSGVGRLDKIIATLAAFVLPGWFTQCCVLRSGRAAMDDLVTIIFSSGSTGEPKGVMLSHHNVVSNTEAVIQVIDPTVDDRVVGVLPLFHSFGFLANLCVPFMAGCGAVFHNNPLDSKEVGDLTERYGGTIFLATPTFLRSYTRKVPPEQFKTIRRLLTGAEKLPREVADAFREKFGVDAMEGYGCTELSPVVAVNVPNFEVADGVQIGNKPGTVGHPIPGVAVKIVDPDTGENLPLGADGLLLVKGPNVMQGYWRRPDLTAEALRDGWYVTGDIAHLDEDGFITITDRLSRFSKIAGEMVPHIRVEEAIRKILDTDEQTAVVTGVPDSTRGERLIVLHTALPISVEELWKRLNESGLPKLWVPSRDAFHQVAEFPYLGSGKLDMRRIKELAREFA